MLDRAQRRERQDIFIDGRQTDRSAVGTKFPGATVKRMLRRRPEMEIHESDAAQFGDLPTLAWLDDHLLEALPIRARQGCAPRSIDATRVGADLSGVVDQFQNWMLHDRLTLGLCGGAWSIVLETATLFERCVVGDQTFVGKKGMS
jgi:hypothetical protein